MRLAFISTMGGIPWGGSEVLWAKTAKLALTNGHQVFISTYKWDKLPTPVNELKNMGAHILLRKLFNPKMSLGKKIKNYIINKYFKQDLNFKELWDFNPDHILISQGESFDLAVHYYNLYLEINRRQTPYSVICHSHQQYSAIPEESIYPRGKEVYSNATNLFFVSNRQKNLMERRLCSKLNNGHITWNPLNLKEHIIQPLKGKTDIINFAIVGSLGGQKGQDTIMEILSHNNWKDRKWHLNIYGDGNGKQYLMDLAIFYNISNNVSFHGHVNNIIKVWQNNHILLIPSAGEGLPISLCEAMMCGRPSVVTDVGGHSEIIEEGVEGFIAEAPTVSSFENALERAWSNKNRWQEMGKAAHSKITSKLDLTPERTLLNKSLLHNGTTSCICINDGL